MAGIEALQLAGRYALAVKVDIRDHRIDAIQQDEVAILQPDTHDTVSSVIMTPEFVSPWVTSSCGMHVTKQMQMHTPNLGVTKVPEYLG